MITADELAGPDGESFRFENIGDTAKGKVVHADKRVRTNKFTQKDEEVVRVTLVDGSGDNIVLWVVTNNDVKANGYPSRMARAISASLRAAESGTLTTGGTLAVQYTADIPTDMGNPAKEYVAQFQPPRSIEPTTSDGAVTGLI